MHSRQLQNALKELVAAGQKVDAVIEEMRAEHDALAVFIFIARRSYRRTPGSKDGKRQRREAEQSYRDATALGFRGQFREWERLLNDWKSPEE